MSDNKSFSYTELALERKQMYKRGMRDSFILFGICAISAIAVAYILVNFYLSAYALAFWAAVGFILIFQGLVSLFDAGYYRAAGYYDPQLVRSGGKYAKLKREHSDFLIFHNERMITLVVDCIEKVVLAKNNPATSDESIEDETKRN